MPGSTPALRRSCTGPLRLRGRERRGHTLLEDAHVNSRLGQTFLVPQGARKLSFHGPAGQPRRQPGGNAPDAFEAALLGAAHFARRAGPGPWRTPILDSPTFTSPPVSATSIGTPDRDFDARDAVSRSFWIATTANYENSAVSNDPMARTSASKLLQPPARPIN